MKKTWRQSILQSLLCDEHIEHFGSLSVGHKKMHGKETFGTFRELTKKLEEVMGCFGGRLPQQGSPSQKQTSGRDISRADFVTERICREAFTMSEGIKKERWRNGASQGPRTLRHCFLFDTGPSIWNGRMLKNFKDQDLAVISRGQFGAGKPWKKNIFYHFPQKPRGFQVSPCFSDPLLDEIWSFVGLADWFGMVTDRESLKRFRFFSTSSGREKNRCPKSSMPPFFWFTPPKESKSDKKTPTKRPKQWNVRSWALWTVSFTMSS